jgi:hypothetical protein
MRRLLLLVAVVMLAAVSSAWAGANPTWKVALHVQNHNSKQSCSNLPALAGCQDIVTTYAGCTDVDVFVVIYDMNEYLGADFGLDWPAEWGSAAFTHCADLGIGDIIDPGDGAALAWATCQYSTIKPIAWVWLFPTAAGNVDIIPSSLSEALVIYDCSYIEEAPAAVYSAGICGAPGDDPCRYPRVWHVPSEVGTIKAALDSSVYGDTVLVAPGTYHEYLLGLKSGVVLASEAGPESTVVDANGISRLFYAYDLESTHVSGFTFTGAWTTGSGGAAYLNSSDVTFQHCIFTGNTAVAGGAVYVSATAAGVSPTFLNCSFVANESGTGASHIHCINFPVVTLGNCVLAYGIHGPAVTCEGSSAALLSCSDVYGNEGGDWVGYIAGQETINGNLSVNPVFCDWPGGDFHLSPCSPCGPDFTGDCGIIGALGVGGGPEPTLTAISDVGNDQGRQVRVKWSRSSCDVPGAIGNVTGYSLYRRQGANLALFSAPVPESQLIDGWDYITTVPAGGDDFYQCIAPTLCDSTATGGVCWSVFMVRALTDDPYTKYESPPDSGYSVDNLAPAPPGNLRLASSVDLVWDKSQDADFDYFTIYGSDVPDFDETAVLIGYTSGTAVDISAEVYGYYYATATDFSGNEGEAASAPNTYADVPGNGRIPPAYALRQNTPNPFEAKTVISFELPEPNFVEIGIYDAAGRLVKSLVSREVAAGRHAVEWLGTDENGAEMGSGLYFVRILAGDFSDTKKMILVQ